VADLHELAECLAEGVEEMVSAGQPVGPT
jgi:hypothetical protein